MRSIGVILFSLATTFAQTNVRGTNEGTNEYKAAPVRTGPKVAWETKTGYRDSGAMVVAAGVLVTGNINGRGGIFGYDAATGRRLWSVPRHMRGDPSTDGAAAYAVNAGERNGFRLVKLDLKTGRVLWAVQEEELGNHNAPPLVADGRVFLASGNRTLAAYDAATGKVVWQHPKSKICSPSLAYAEGTLYFSGGVAGSGDTLTALEATTGKVIWSTKPQTEFGVACADAAAVSGGVLVTRAGDTVYALDAKTGAARWKQAVSRMVNGRKVRPHLHELAITGGVVYTSVSFGIVGWQLDTGQPVFDFASRLATDANDIRMAAAGGVLYFSGNAELPPERDSSGGWIYALDLATKKLLWKHHAARPDQYDPEGTWWTRYMLPVDGGLYFETQGLLVKLAQ